MFTLVVREPQRLPTGRTISAIQHLQRAICQSPRLIAIEGENVWNQIWD
jgi:hypothetical protein